MRVRWIGMERRGISKGRWFEGGCIYVRWVRVKVCGGKRLMPVYMMGEGPVASLQWGGADEEATCIIWIIKLLRWTDVQK